MAVNKYTAKNGKTKWYFSVRYTDWTGKNIRKKQEGFTTQREAKEAENKFLESCKTDATITFEALTQAYLNDRKLHISPTTMQTKEHVLHTKILPYFASLPINTIDISKVKMWQNELIASEKHYSPTYLKTAHNLLSAIFNFAVKYYGLRENPARLCGSMGKQRAEKMEFWTLDEFKKFIKAADEDITAKTIFTLLFYSGMREGELLALTLNDFDFEKKFVSISKNYAKIKGYELIKEPKTPKSKRKISLPSPVLDLVKEYANHLCGYKPDQRLFQNKKTLYAYMDKYSAAAGVKRIRIHDLRHSHASLLVEMNVPILQISERLGHENIQTTLDIYSHLYPDKQGKIADMLAEIM